MESFLEKSHVSSKVPTQMKTGMITGELLIQLRKIISIKNNQTNNKLERLLSKISLLKIDKLSSSNKTMIAEVDIINNNRDNIKEIIITMNQIKIETSSHNIRYI